MALFMAFVSKWQTDSWKRVRDASPGTYYLLNSNRLDSIIEKKGDATLYYFDNPFDARDAGHYMVLDQSVADLILQMDTAMAHASVTLPIYPNNDPTETAEDTTIAVKDIAWAVLDANNASRAWVGMSEDGWDFKEVLVNRTAVQIYTAVAV